MPIYEFKRDGVRILDATTFSAASLHERRDLQRLLREQIEIVAPGALLVAEEFGDWEGSSRRIDLLAIDKAANLVVVELKRTEDGGHMELQAIRYASMVAAMTFDQVADAFGNYLTSIGKEGSEARPTLLDFLEWDEVDEESFGHDVRIVLVSADFSKELISSVLWLNEHGTDIRCVRLKPYRLDERILVDAQQIVPLPEAADYQFQIRDKTLRERQSRSSGADFTRFDVTVADLTYPAQTKRYAIFLVCRILCQRGIEPEAIARLFQWRTSRVWFAVNGQVDESEFKRLASEKAISLEIAFDSRRWFCANGELVHVNGRTYAFSNQWGGDPWHKAMGLLKQNFPDFKMTFQPTNS